MLFVGSLAGVAPSTAAASPAPAACDGQAIVLINHVSGPSGASGNVQASAGPGYFLGSATAGGITDIRNEFCS